MPITVAEGFDPVAGSRREHGERGDRGTRRAHARPTHEPRAPRADRPPRDEARAERPPRSEARTERPPREDPRIERERAYELNPDQPLPMARDDAGVPRSAGLGPRAGFGQGRPVPALLMKRPAVPAEPEGG